MICFRLAPLLATLHRKLYHRTLDRGKESGGFPASRQVLQAESCARLWHSPPEQTSRDKIFDHQPPLTKTVHRLQSRESLSASGHLRPSAFSTQVSGLTLLLCPLDSKITLRFSRSPTQLRTKVSFC